MLIKTNVKKKEKQYEIITVTKEEIEEHIKKLENSKEETYKILLEMKSRKWPNKTVT